MAAPTSKVTEPRLKIPQDPPGLYPLSITATFRCRLAKRLAAVSPDNPPPIMIASYPILIPPQVLRSHPRYSVLPPLYEVRSSRLQHVYHRKQLHIQKTDQNYYNIPKSGFDFCFSFIQFLSLNILFKTVYYCIFSSIYFFLEAALKA